MYKEEYYDYSGKEGKWIKDELKKRGFHHVTISNFPADFFRMSKSQLEKLFEKASDAFISEMYDVPIQQIQNRRSDFEIKQLGCTINRMWREEELAQTVKEILRIVSNEYNNGNIPHTNSTPLNSEKEFFTREAWQGSRAPIQNLRFCKWVRFFRHEVWQGSRAPIQNLRFCKWVRFLYMKATGIVRRIDAGVIITPKPKKVHKCWDFCKFAPLNALVSKTGF